jgi:hypothetical protein
MRLTPYLVDPRHFLVRVTRKDKPLAIVVELPRRQARR